MSQNKTQAVQQDGLLSPKDPLPVTTSNQIEKGCDPANAIAAATDKDSPEEIKKELERFTFTEANDDDEGDQDGKSIKTGEKILETRSSGGSTPHTPVPRKRFSIGSKSVIPSLLSAGVWSSYNLSLTLE